jgi:hypothetical protein
MQRTFANAALLSATVLSAFMIMIPINHLSAQNEIKIDEKAKVRKVTVEDFNKENGTFSANIDGLAIPVVMDASTTVFLGNGDETATDSLRDGANVYVFGNYDPESKSIAATKVVIRNKRITERTSLSRAQLEAESSSGTLGALGLSTR